MKLRMVCIAWLAAACLANGMGRSVPGGRLPPASAEKLPRWRGFNLTNKFQRDWRNGPFLEEDFRLISELGFNFVRLPMDYRTWIRGDDWTEFNEDILAEIDQAVEWGRVYGIHVCINFHRAPGYTVASPPEPKDLWTDEDAQRVCALHWGTFARRYRDVPNTRLSFNLFNEPSHVDSNVYAQVAGIVAGSIRKEDPERLIIADGLEWGQHPCEPLLPLNVAQATRGYVPSGISHYRASWVHGGDTMPPPAWPQVVVGTGYLYGTQKADIAKPLVINGQFAVDTTVRVRVGVVSKESRLLCRADGKAVIDRLLVSGPDSNTCERVVFHEEYNVYQNVFNRDVVGTVPAGARRIEIANEAGDWMTVTEVAFGAPGSPTGEHVLTLRDVWEGDSPPYRYDPDGGASPFKAEAMRDREWLWNEHVEPWYMLRKRGVGVIVGEWGAYNKTPHDITLRWMEDCLRNWKRAGVGWALWNFRGSFGIIDSGRADVTYEDFRGVKLDRKMLDLLQRY
jgi:hypothetical protein